MNVKTYQLDHLLFPVRECLVVDGMGRTERTGNLQLFVR